MSYLTTHTFFVQVYLFISTGHSCKLVISHVHGVAYFLYIPPLLIGHGVIHVLNYLSVLNMDCLSLSGLGRSNCFITLSFLMRA